MQQPTLNPETKINEYWNSDCPYGNPDCKECGKKEVNIVVEKVRDEFERMFTTYSEDGKIAYPHQSATLSRKQVSDLIAKVEQRVRKETAIRIVDDINSPSIHEPNKHSIVWGIMKGWGIEPNDLLKTITPPTTNEREE